MGPINVNCLYNIGESFIFDADNRQGIRTIGKASEPKGAQTLGLGLDR